MAKHDLQTTALLQYVNFDLFQGMFVARGKNLLFADADGASKFSDLQKLEKAMSDIQNQDSMGVVCGSRAHLAQDSVVKVHLYIIRIETSTNCQFLLHFLRSMSSLVEYVYFCFFYHVKFRLHNKLCWGINSLAPSCGA